jgi:hypothetical protein
VIASLTFGAPQGAGARVLRRIAFASRSTLPLSAACLVANGVRETLSRLLAAEFEVDLIEPAIPDAGERRILLDGATILRVRGRLCDGFVILRPADAQRLVALAFAEEERSERAPLSGIESATLDRIASALVPLCNTLCGTLGPVTRELAERAACDLSTYFEVRTTGSVRVTLGFGLSRDPGEEIGERITLEDLADVELEGTVEFGRGTLGVPAFSRLACGVTLALDTPLGGDGVLRFGDVRFTRGNCGVHTGRNAFVCESDLERGAA